MEFFVAMTQARGINKKFGGPNLESREAVSRLYAPVIRGVPVVLAAMHDA